MFAGVIRHPWLQTCTSVQWSLHGSLSQLRSCPAPTPPHPTPPHCLHSPYTIAPDNSVLSLLNAGNIVLLSALTGLIRWLENMCPSAFQVQVPFLGMEIPCSAAGKCVGKHFEIWNPAHCSSRCYNYFLCLWESLFCDTRKMRKQNSHLLKNVFLIMPGECKLVIFAYIASILPPLSNAQLFGVGHGEHASLLPPPPDSRLARGKSYQ